MNGYQIVSEALIFSKDDTIRNLDLWKQGKVKSLFIVGYLGSGKSTTAKELAKKYNAEYIELDIVREKYLKKHIDYSTTPDQETVIFDRLLANIEKKAKTISKRIVFEGIDVIWLSIELLRSQAIIIKGSSALTSTYRGWKRDLDRKAKGEDAWFRDKNKYQMFKELLKNQRMFYKYIENLRKKIKQ